MAILVPFNGFYVGIALPFLAVALVFICIGLQKLFKYLEFMQHKRIIAYFRRYKDPTQTFAREIFMPFLRNYCLVKAIGSRQDESAVTDPPWTYMQSNFFSLSNYSGRVNIPYWLTPPPRWEDGMIPPSFSNSDNWQEIVNKILLFSDAVIIDISEFSWNLFHEYEWVTDNLSSARILLLCHQDYYPPEKFDLYQQRAEYCYKNLSPKLIIYGSGFKSICKSFYFLD
jgi:hypothetical protein